MTLSSRPQRGGFKRAISLSLFIRDYLSASSGTGHDIYTAYKKAVQSQPSTEYLARGRKQLRRAIARSKRTRPHERVKVSAEEIESRLPGWIADHPGQTKKRVCSYNSFMHYIYVLKKLNLIEETDIEQPAGGKSGTGTGDWHDAHPSKVLRAVPGGLSDPGWQNIWQAAYG